MATALVNKHITRALAAGADAATVADAYLTGLDAMLSAQGLHAQLQWWTNPKCGVVKNGSNEISKVLDFGTTRLPRYGDYCPETPSTVTYSATGMNATAPAWVNASSSARGYYGSARDGGMRYNNIRRLHDQGISLVAAYSKSHANLVTLIGLGEFGGFSLQNTSGASGAAKMNVGGWSNAWSINSTHATTLSNSVAHVIGGTFDGTTAVSYVEGVAGPNSSAATQDYAPLLGGVITARQNIFLCSGTQNSRLSLTNNSTALVRQYSNTEAQFSGNTLAGFAGVLTPTQMAAVTAFIRSDIGP